MRKLYRNTYSTLFLIVTLLVLHTYTCLKIINIMRFRVMLLVFVIPLSSVLCAYQRIASIHRSPRSTAVSYSTFIIHPFHTSYSNSNETPESYEQLAGPFADGERWINNIYSKDPFSGLVVEVSRNKRITPDGSNGLDYPDPYLITGLKAHAIAKILYSNELFFSNYPHASAVLRNQKLRQDNGIEKNRLGSLRHGSPFFHHRRQYVYVA